MLKKLEPRVSAVSWRENVCLLLDQTQLPSVETYLSCQNFEEVVTAIKRLAVRGAPAIGVAGAYAVVLAASEARRRPTVERASHLRDALEKIRKARPTAVNLSWAVARMERCLAISDDIDMDALLAEARSIHDEDVAGNSWIAEIGARVLPSGGVLTICNTGDLATGGIGTAFGIIREGFRQKRISHVFACETRPVLQGLRLTAWELAKNEIPFTVICDSMAADTMRRGDVGSILVGADRIAANGDTANKVGTYALAVLARYHGIPFFVVAPSSTFDMRTKTGEGIVIEERAPEEILSVLGNNRGSFDVRVRNPSFDVTPFELISGIICEKGIISSPESPESFFQ